MSQESRLDRIPIGLMIIVSIIIVVPIATFWDSWTDPNWKSHSQKHDDEREKVRNMSCDELKNYIIAGLEGEYNYYAKRDLAKDLFTWKCEK